MLEMKELRPKRKRAMKTYIYKNNDGNNDSDNNAFVKRSINICYILISSLKIARISCRSEQQIV